jgi:hypothetical protein
MNHLRVRGAVLAKVVIAAVAILLDSFVSDGVFTRAEIGLLPGTTFAQRNSPRSAYDFQLLAYEPVMKSMQKRTNPPPSAFNLRWTTTIGSFAVYDLKGRA